MLVSEGHDVTEAILSCRWGHGNVWAQDVAEAGVWDHSSAVAGEYVDVHGLCYYRGPWEECMLKSKGCAELAPPLPGHGIVALILAGHCNRRDGTIGGRAKQDSMGIKEFALPLD